MKLKDHLCASLIVAALTVAALLLPACSTTPAGTGAAPAAPLPLEYYD